MTRFFDKQEQKERTNDFKKKWLEAHQSVVPNDSIEQIIQTVQGLDDNIPFPNQMAVVYRVQDLKIFHVCSNVEKILGYTQEKFLGWKESAFFKIGGYNQPNYFIDISVSYTHLTLPTICSV